MILIIYGHGQNDSTWLFHFKYLPIYLFICCLRENLYVIQFLKSFMFIISTYITYIIFTIYFFYIYKE